MKKMSNEEKQSYVRLLTEALACDYEYKDYPYTTCARKDIYNLLKYIQRIQKKTKSVGKRRII